MSMELAGKIAFWFYTAVIVSGGALAVTSPSLVRAMMGLIATLFGVAGMYLLLNAPLLAFMQLLIYVGAVSVLIFFAIMFTKASAEGDEGVEGGLWTQARSVLAFALPLCVLGLTAFLAPPASIPVPVELGADKLGQGLLGPYTLAFELISIVLLAAMAGAVLLAFEKRGSK